MIPRFSPNLSMSDLAAAWRGRNDDESAVREFEDAFAAYLGRRHAIAVASARAGLYLLLTTAPRRIATAAMPALTYWAVPSVCLLADVHPAFVDIDLETMLMDEARLAALPGEVGAIVATHLYGRVQDMDAIIEFAKRRGALVIEDVAQGLGAAWRGKPCGSFGDAAYFTFGPTKNFTTLGGGMVALDDDAWASRIRERLAAGRRTSRTQLAKRAAFASAMRVAADRRIFAATLAPALRALKPRGIDVIDLATADPPRAYDRVPADFLDGLPSGTQARVGLSQLEKLDAQNARRRANGLHLARLLDGTPGLHLGHVREGETPIFMSFPVLVNAPDELARRLVAHGVDSARGYMSACADERIFARYRSDCPNARRAADSILHLPVHPDLTASDLAHIARAVRECVTHMRVSS
ncbi:MAG: DegT/DnrJ/EryC1/StrS family aminotransferase [Deltaproteobacteria bacterium]|nr:DegT/DnrJ/EryC1/StrS family aminotransferase [Deltaproteobacteria bacterium]